MSFRTLRSPIRSLTFVAAATGLLSGASALAATKEDDKGKPNPVINAISNTVAKVRADDDQLAVATAFESLQPKAIEKMSVEEARANPTPADAVKLLLKQQGRSSDPAQLVPGITSQDRTIPGSAGPLPARVYTPDGKGPFPVIVYFHGGGWVIADKAVYDGGARGLAKAANAVVVSVDYRRAPEAKFPAAWDDALAAYKWVAANAKEVQGDAARLALAGESAGGNLAIATAIAARDSGIALPKAILSVYPVAQTGSLNTVSYIENAIAKPLNKSMIEWFLDKLLRTPDDKKDTRLDLVHAKLTGLPPVTIINASIDPLRSDGEMLEEALRKAGVSVERKLYSGVAHEFFGAAAVIAKAQEAQSYAGTRMRSAFSVM
ncbi:MAG: alpha/beta hydrolase [Panacagrimonas sp.]